MAKNLKEDLFNHLLSIHDYESFGKAIVYNIMMQAKNEMDEKGDSDKIRLELPIRVEKWGDETKCWKIEVAGVWTQVQE